MFGLFRHVPHRFSTIENRLAVLEGKVAALEAASTAQLVAVREIAASAERHMRRTLTAERRAEPVAGQLIAPATTRDAVSARIWERRNRRAQRNHGDAHDATGANQ